METKIIITGDGSHSIEVQQLNAMYHSVYGAIRESRHVFIEAGLNYLLNSSTAFPVRIFEMGLGTGLNAFLTLIEAEEKRVKINYTSIEKFPLSFQRVNALNYPQYLQNKDLLLKLHESKWAATVAISEYFTLRKEEADLEEYNCSGNFHLIYYDAFAPKAQPGLWTTEIFEKLFHMLQTNGVVVTYCSKGAVRRAMVAAGFTVKKLPGPPGKREMLRAVKSG